MTDSVAATLAEQQEYYRARAGEYDEWWFRRGRYNRGADLTALWFADAAEVERALDALDLGGRILGLGPGFASAARASVLRGFAERADGDGIGSAAFEYQHDRASIERRPNLLDLQGLLRPYRS